MPGRPCKGSNTRWIAGERTVRRLCRVGKTVCHVVAAGAQRVHGFAHAETSYQRTPLPILRVRRARSHAFVWADLEPRTAWAKSRSTVARWIAAQAILPTLRFAAGTRG